MDTSDSVYEPPKSVLELKSLLQSACNFLIEFSDGPNIVNKEQSLVVKDIEKLVEDDNKMKRIMNGVEAIFANDEYLKKALLPTVLKKEGVTFVMEQESLIRLLLRVNKLQEPVFELIKDQLIKVCSDSLDCYLLTLLLNPLKYLPNIKNVQQFSGDILDCLELCEVPMQLEILYALPDIIPDNCYDSVAEQLLKLLNSSDCPASSVIDCLGAFDFSEEVKSSMFSQLIDKILPLKLNCMPTVLNLVFSTYTGKIPLSELKKLRVMIDNIVADSEDAALIYSTIKTIEAFACKENIAQSFVDLVNCMEHPKDHRAFDLFILLILGDDIKYKELIRKRIESSHFTSQLLNCLLLDLSYFKALISSDQGARSLIKLASYLLKFHSVKVENITRDLLSAMISASMEEGRFLINANEIVDCLLKACNNSDMKCVCQALMILESLMNAHPKRFYGSLNKLMGLLKKIDDFDLLAARLAYSVLCHIPYEVDRQHPQSEVMRNEINMNVKKKLMNSKRMRKSIGVMGSICQIQKSVGIGDPSACGQGHTQVQLLELIDPPPPSIQEAVDIIETVTVLTEGIPECTGLFYDELSQVVARFPLKIEFIMWLLRRTRELLDNYIADPLQPNKEINGMVFASRFGSTRFQKLTLNIGLMTLEPDNYEGSPIILLAPLFRLYRALVLGKHEVHPTVSELFMSFISCSFVLPEVEYYDDLNHDQLKQVVDLVFHSINYLKEVVSASSRAISTSRNSTGRIKFQDFLKERLELLLKLEYVFDSCLNIISEHSFPQVYFHDCSKNKQVHETKKKPVKKKAYQSKALLDDTAASISVLSRKETQTHPSTSRIVQKELKSGPKCAKGNNIHLREIDLLSLLQIVHYSKEGSDERLLGYPILVYILKDLVRGFKVSLLGQKNLTHYNWQVKPDDQVKEIAEDLNGVIKSFYNLINNLDDIVSSADYDETHCDLVMCYTCYLEMFCIVLSTTIEQSSNFTDQINKVLNPDFDSSERPRKKIIKLAEILIAHLKYCAFLSQAVLLFRMVDSIIGSENTKHRTELISKLGEDIVTKRWTVPKFVTYSDKQSSEDTKFILEKYFREVKVSYLFDLMSKVAGEYTELKTKKDYLLSYSIITYSNFHVLYFTLCATLRSNLEKEIKTISSLIAKLEKMGTREMSQEVRNLKMEQLKLWKNTTNIMFHLMEIARNTKNRQNNLFSVFLKRSIPILKIFIDLALPLFNEMFPSKLEIVVDILKSMQTSTRFLHHLCCQSKMFKNLALVSHIPSFRLVLEQLIYKVKALLVSHNCEDAFFLGNLKNKDIYGNTQTSEPMDEDSQENDQEEDEEMLPSDDEEDVTMEDDKSESLTF